MKQQWTGVFPATTTQFGRDAALDLPASQKVVDGLIADGVNGIICMGTVGENCSLTAQEKRALLAAVKEVVKGRVPVVSGVAEYTTALAVEFRAHSGWCAWGADRRVHREAAAARMVAMAGRSRGPLYGSGHVAGLSSGLSASTSRAAWA